MSSIREQIIQALVDKVKTSFTGVAVQRSRVSAWTRRELPAISIEVLGDQPDQTMLGVITWTLNVRFAVYVADDIPDQAADPITSTLHKTLMSDKSLGGLIMDIEPADVKFDLFNGDGPRGEVSMAFRVTYRTIDADVSQQG